VLQVVAPLTFVHGPVHVPVDACTVRFVVRPLAVVLVAIHVFENALSVRSVLAPLARVLRAVRPNLHAVAVAEAAPPLAIVPGFRFESVFWPHHSRRLPIVNVLRHCFLHFLDCEVLA